MLQKILILIFFPLSLFASSLDLLEYELKQELEYLNLPAKPWRDADDPICDVAIIGAGMSGLSLSFALKNEGIYNVKIFEAAEKDECHWLSTARMKTLRSKKELAGPALGIAKLTFRAWYEAQYTWNDLEKIPTSIWAEYLKWYKKVLDIKVHNNHRLISIFQNSDGTLQLSFENGFQTTARKVVLATGRIGFGGLEIPDFVSKIPKEKWYHTAEVINPNMFRKKEVCIIGAGASAFDVAATALENGASGVSMLMRRQELPKVNYFAVLSSVGLLRAYHSLDDDKKMDMFKTAMDQGIPPPPESLERIKNFKNFSLLPNTYVKKVYNFDNYLHVETNQNPLHVDILILATGYAVDGKKQKELAEIFPNIVLWKDIKPNISKKMGQFPYLGDHFEFKEKSFAPYLRHIHCFNYAAFLSHWRVSGDIDCLPIGVKKLAESIASDLFTYEEK